MATPTTLPATFVSGDVLTAAQMNDLRGAFRVLQVVVGTTTTSVSNSTNVYADTTLTATITPTSTNNKILIYVNHASVYKSVTDAVSRLNMIFLRGATNLLQFGTAIAFTGTASENYSNAPMILLDTPATISATTYKTQFMNPANAAFVSVQSNSTESQMLLMEISA